MNESKFKSWPLFANVLILWLAVFILLAASYERNENTVVYSLDDAYIHMAMARNFAQFGVWGVTKYEFTSSSSSILWTLALASSYYVFGVNELSPLFLNMIFGSLVMISSFYVLRRFDIKNIHIFIILMCLIFISPLPPLMLTGLEHVLHIWLSILFVTLVSEKVVSNGPDKKKVVLLAVVALLLPLVRYEGIVLTAAAALLFLFKGKWQYSIWISVFSFIPIFMFGLISINNGWSFFPNSLLLKGSFPDVVSFRDFIKLFGFLYDVFVPPGYVVLLIAVAGVLIIMLFFAFRKRAGNLLNLESTYLLLLFAVNVILYAAYSKSGWSYRYQSFLVGLGILIISIVFFRHILKDYKKFLFLKIVLSFFLMLLPLIYFGYTSFDLLKKSPASSINIYEQQYQMGHFLRNYYQHKGVALNDVGASNFFADIRCLDLWGLSNLEISKKRRLGSFTDGDIRVAAKMYDVDIAILYDSWFTEENISILPEEWVKAGEWRIQNNVIAGDEVVAFYSVKPDAEPDLVSNLRSFSKSLPEGVIQSGEYMNQ